MTNGACCARRVGMTHFLPVRELFVSPDAATALGAEAEKLPAWALDAHQVAELDLLLSGGFTPLRGYMTEADYRAACEGGDRGWPVPFALRVAADFARGVEPGHDIALRDAGGVVAVLSVTDRWGDPARLGGKVKGLRRPGSGPTPNALRALFRGRGPGQVLAVLPASQADVDMAATLVARMGAALLVQPSPGVVVDAPGDAVLAPLAAGPPEGPRGLLWQALVARNHGATHLFLPDDAAREIYRPHQDRIGLPMVLPDGNR